VGTATKEKEEKEDLIVHTQAMRHRSIGALLGLRVILVANIILLTVLGVLFSMSYERPGPSSASVCRPAEVSRIVKRSRRCPWTHLVTSLDRSI